MQNSLPNPKVRVLAAIFEDGLAFVEHQDRVVSYRPPFSIGHAASRGEADIAVYKHDFIAYRDLPEDQREFESLEAFVSYLRLCFRKGEPEREFEELDAEVVSLMDRDMLAAYIEEVKWYPRNADETPDTITTLNSISAYFGSSGEFSDLVSDCKSLLVLLKDHAPETIVSTRGIDISGSMGSSSVILGTGSVVAPVRSHVTGANS